MKSRYKDHWLFVPLLTLFVRFWMLFILPTIGNFSPLYKFDHSKYHHWEIGLGFIVVGYLVRYFRKYKRYSQFFIVVGLSLVLDEYTFLLKLFGFSVPYQYLSGMDNLVLIFGSFALMIFYFASRKRSKLRRK